METLAHIGSPLRDYRGYGFQRASQEARVGFARHSSDSVSPFTAMSTTEIHREFGVEWSVLSRAAPGQAVSGDLHLVIGWPDGVLFAVADGLGHGEEATAAARRAIDVLAEHPSESTVRLMQRCHAALQRTRGVVMTLVSLNTHNHTAAMLGVGNVETVLLRADARIAPRRESVLLRGGVVGYQLPTLQASFVSFAPGDLLVFATDGLREDFSDLLNPADSVAQTVDRIMSRKFRGTDDGLVLACEYVGSS